MRRTWLTVVAMAGLALVGSLEARGQLGCGRFGFTGRGIGCGSSRFLASGFCGPRFGWGGRCSPWLGWRAPCWGPPVCGPAFGWGCWPNYGFGGWYGTGFAYGAESVFLAAPFGGGATFFSGSVVPFPVPVWAPGAWYPGPAPLWFGGASRPTATVASAPSRPAAPAPRFDPASAIAVRPRPNPPRTTTVAARRRAARLVAAGDRQLLASGGERAGLTAAAASYRRAAAAAADDPDLHIREALVLTWLGRQEAAAAACGRAVAVDGRLADRQAGDPPGIVARGQRLIDELASGLAADDIRGRAALASLKERWQPGQAAPVAALAVTSPADR
ncbi:MAG: hypothetical protein RLZZ440_299 [Planctomycetota bacterium]